MTDASRPDPRVPGQPGPSAPRSGGAAGAGAGGPGRRDAAPGADGDRSHVADAGIVDAEIVEAEIVEPEHDEAAYGTGAGADEQAAAAPGEPGPGPEGDETLDAAAAAVRGDLEDLHKQRAEYLDLARRTQADFENFRKRTQKQQDDAVQRAVGRFVEGLLPVLDACDAAVAHGAADAVEPVLGALYGALEKEGLERIDPTGKAFDPAEAEAVMHEPGQGGDQVVAEVMRAGYRWRGRVLRPAMVKVTD